VKGSDSLGLKSLRELVYEYLHRAINSGQLEPGSFIDQKKLAAELGISRQPMRDALIQLELEGFVTVIPRRGVEVRRLTLEDIRQLYEVIGALEGYVVSHASTRVREPEVAEMRRLNERMVEAIEAGDFDTYYDFNLAFHNVYLETSDNPLLLHTVQICKQRLYDFPRERRFHKEWELASTKEHQRIIDLLARSKFAEAAEYVTDVHWSYDVQCPWIHAYYHMDDPDVRTIANVGPVKRGTKCPPPRPARTLSGEGTP
jgi:DNA-binding GntR family transcriptional regulator